MPQIESSRRIIKEEFKQEDRDTIDRLAFVLNSFMEQVIDTINGKIDFANLNQEIKTINVIVDSNGIPTTTLNVKHDLSTKTNGIVCINAKNLTNSSTYPSGAIFLTTTPSEGITKINNITGLQANNKYSLTLLLIGKDI
jgi:hypothetical protein